MFFTSEKTAGRGARGQDRSFIGSKASSEPTLQAEAEPAFAADSAKELTRRDAISPVEKERVILLPWTRHT